LVAALKVITECPVGRVISGRAKMKFIFVFYLLLDQELPAVEQQ
jgi:hypothetical protein